jgi:uncharacterized membrane protein YidH (DUF202 family)
VSERDPGLQPERTVLAWRRTAFALLVNGILLLREAAIRGSPALTITGGVLLVCCIGVSSVGVQRRQALLSGKAISPSALTMRATTSAAILACVASAFLAWR